MQEHAILLDVANFMAFEDSAAATSGRRHDCLIAPLGTQSPNHPRSVHPSLLLHASQFVGSDRILCIYERDSYDK